MLSRRARRPRAEQTLGDVRCPQLAPLTRLVARKAIDYAMLQDWQMKRDVTEILKKALDLPPEARAAIAGSLLDSLDAEVDEDVEAAWEAEILRRLEELNTGRVSPVPWAEARRRIAGSG